MDTEHRHRSIPSKAPCIARDEEKRRRTRDAAVGTIQRLRNLLWLGLALATPGTGYAGPNPALEKSSLWRPGTRALGLNAPESVLRLAPAPTEAPGGKMVTGTLQTPFGPVSIDKNLPATPSDAAWVFETLETQYATQCYLWALPFMATAEWGHAHREFGAGNCDLVVYSTYEEKLGILTANPLSSYAVTFTNLAETGPLVVEVPPGPLSGGFGDYWQHSLMVVGSEGMDGGSGGRYLLLPPGTTDDPVAGPDPIIVPCPRNLVRIGFRTSLGDPTAARKLLSAIRIYPYAERATPTPTRLLSSGGRRWYAGQPRGLAYWERLHEVLRTDTIGDRDGFQLAMLRQLGIDLAAPFAPDEAKKKILVEGAKMGELIARTSTFSRHIPQTRHWPGRLWEQALTDKPSDGSSGDLAGRSARHYQTVMKTSGAVSTTPGVGVSYVAAYTDSRGAWLDGGRDYTLRLPEGVPVRDTWSVTVYDTDTRCFIENQTCSADRNSRMDLLREPDGSIVLYFGPKAPVGRERNWVETVPGRTWFSYFRFHQPEEAYFDRTWVPSNIEPAE